jgi:hypothetical protein
MRVQMNVRSSFIVGVAVLTATTSGLACYEGPPSSSHGSCRIDGGQTYYEIPGSFQPITYGAKPWNPQKDIPNYDPNNPWDPEPPCVTGYYVAIDSCPCCTGISYALCTGVTFTQCVCGGPFWPGVQCPKSLVCCPNDFPPYNWLEHIKYSGPGWAGLSPGADTRTCSGSPAYAGADASRGPLDASSVDAPVADRAADAGRGPLDASSVDASVADGAEDVDSGP